MVYNSNYYRSSYRSLYSCRFMDNIKLDKCEGKREVDRESKEKEKREEVRGEKLNVEKEEEEYEFYFCFEMVRCVV